MTIACWLFGHDFRIQRVIIGEEKTTTITMPSVWCARCGIISEKRLRLLNQVKVIK